LLIARRAEAERTLETAQAQIEKLEEAHAVINELQEERIAHESRLAQLKQHVEATKAQIGADEQKLRVLLANPQAQCPLCDSQLGEHGREHIQESIEDEITLLQGRIEEYTQEARLLQKKKTALDAPLAEAQNTLRNSQRLHAAAERARAAVNAIIEGATRMDALEKERAQVQASLDSGDFAPEQSAALQAAQAELGAIEYSTESHEAATRRVRELSKFEREIAALRLAEDQVVASQKRLNDLQPQLLQLEQESRVAPTRAKITPN
jgi:exonuclease SbcC